jgi:hypothetical protein
MRAHPADIRAPHLAGVRAPLRRARPTPLVCAPPYKRARPPHMGACPSQMCVPPSSQVCAPSPPPCVAPRRHARLARSHAHPASTNARAFIAGGRTRYIRRGPSHPHFTMLSFVSWDSFVGSLHEVVGMVQHFRFYPFNIGLIL